MPSFVFTGPDGKKYRVRGPAGSTQEQAFGVLQQRQPELFNVPAPPDEALTVDQDAEAPRGFVRGLRDPIDASAQLLERVLPEGVVQGINRANDFLVDLGLPLERMGQEGLQGQLARLDEAYEARRAAEGDTGVDWDRMAGNIAGTVIPGVAAARAGALPAAAGTVGGRMAQGTAAGALGGALGAPTTGDPGDFWQDKAAQAALGALGGAVGTGAGNLVGRMGAQARRPEIAELRARGVEPTFAQTMGGPISRIEEKLASVPIVGDAIAASRRGAREQFNRGAVNEVLQDVGRTLPDDVPTGNRAVGYAQEAVSKAYEDAADMVPGITMNDAADAQIANLRQMLQSAPAEVENSFERFMTNNFNRRRGGAAGFEPINFKQLDADIGKRIRGARDELEKDAFMELRRILRSRAAEVSPAYGRALDSADSAYAKLVRLENAANRAALQEGVFTPGQLIMGARAADRSTRRRAAARGDALMQDFGSSGQQVLGDVVPNSGTFDRAGMFLGGAGLFTDPTATLLTLGGGALPFLPQVQPALTALARRVPEFQPGLLTGLGAGAAANESLR